MRAKMLRKMLKWFISYSLAFSWLLGLNINTSAQVSFRVERIPTGGIPGVGQAPLETVEIQGVSAGNFNPNIWLRNQLHWVSDIRYPVLAPKYGGPFRNIYAPSAVLEPWGWRLFYSGWDGTETPNDRIYECTTPDFLDFDHRHMVIDHGAFVHVSNVSVSKLSKTHYIMLATAAVSGTGPYRETDKPVEFFSKDGESWNGPTIPYEPVVSDVIKIKGYDYARAELNGANALIDDDGTYRLYFTDWHHPNRLLWAEGTDSSTVTFGGSALDTTHAVNEVRTLTVGGKKWYLMGLYKKGDVGLTARDSNHLWFSLSQDGHHFDTEELLTSARGNADKFIFSMGFVLSSERVLGILYGAGSVASDDRNQIFAWWLQKRVVLTGRPGFNEGNGAQYEAEGALGPDRQWILLPKGAPFDGTLTLYSEDGITKLGTIPVHLDPGAIYRIVWK